MKLSNSFKAIVHYILIGRMTGLGHRDEIPMVSALVCIVTHWIRLTVSHDIRLSGSNDFTKLLCYIVSQDTELVPKLVVALTYGKNPKMIIYFLY